MSRVCVVWDGVKRIGDREADCGFGRAVRFDGEGCVGWQIIELKNPVGFAIIGGIAARMER